MDIVAQEVVSTTEIQLEGVTIGVVSIVVLEAMEIGVIIGVMNIITEIVGEGVMEVALI